ncbi:REP-associated tyrosine transposase [Paracoccus fontiphilus]|uniref:Transposase n=1 Tax=Paracoccus fontiphilus TaxID=1815556 RepID=A0ABV7IMX8_9RHOB|nr:transposase [Paracoccus fontiphilus]
MRVDQADALREAVRRAERPFGTDGEERRESARTDRFQRRTSEVQVVLPDRLPCISRLPVGDCDYSVRWGAIKARFSRAVRGTVGWNPTLRSASKVAKGDAGVWQRRFWEHHIRDEADFAAHMQYCWFNPVKHGLAERPEDWPYSSFHHDMAAGRVDWGNRIGAP